MKKKNKDEIIGVILAILIGAVTIWAAKEHYTNIRNIAKCGKDWKETGCE